MRFLVAAVVVATISYPLVIYFGLTHFEPRWLALLLLTLVVARASVLRDRLWLSAALVLAYWWWPDFSPTAVCH
jgi:uncharacterized membrane protein